MSWNIIRFGSLISRWRFRRDIRLKSERDGLRLKESSRNIRRSCFPRPAVSVALQEQIFAEEGIKVKPVCAAEEIEVITGLVENGFGISVLPYMDIVRLHNVVDDSGEDFRVEFQILHCEKKVWNPLRSRRRHFFSIGRKNIIKIH